MKAPHHTSVALIRPRAGVFDLDLGALRDYRELLYFLMWRDLKVRYKQTAIGIAWVLLQPLLATAIFTLVFGRLVRMTSDGVPYAVFVYTALVPWTLFSSGVSRSAASVVRDANLVSKVYFPRLVLPLGGALSGLVDFSISCSILLAVLGVAYGIVPGWRLVVMPLYGLLAVATAFAVGVWLAPLNVRYRDVGHGLPFLLQMWMFATPVVYPVSLVPEHWRALYGLNPMAGVIEGFRWALLRTASPDLAVMIMSAFVIFALLVTGLIHFRRMERSFADVI